MPDTMTIPTTTIDYEARWRDARDFRDFLAGAEKHRELWLATARRAEVDDAMIERLVRLRGHWHLLVLADDWCGDAVNTVPYVARLAERAPNVALRVIGRDAYPELMDAHLSGPAGTSRAIPVVIVLDDQFVEHAWWGSRPRALQDWVEREGLAMDKDARYKEVRRWYARDGGRTTVSDVVRLVEEAARQAV